MKFKGGHFAIGAPLAEFKGARCPGAHWRIQTCVLGGGQLMQGPNLGYPQILFSHRISATNFFNTALTP